LSLLRHPCEFCGDPKLQAQGKKSMTENNYHQVFQSFQAIHVGSHSDVVHIKQGEFAITLPAALIPDLMEALELARKGEL